MNSEDPKQSPSISLHIILSGDNFFVAEKLVRKLPKYIAIKLTTVMLSFKDMSDPSQKGAGLMRDYLSVEGGCDKNEKMLLYIAKQVQYEYECGSLLIGQ